MVLSHDLYSTKLFPSCDKIILVLSRSSSQSLSPGNYSSLIGEWSGRNEWRDTEEGFWKRSPMLSPKCSFTLYFQRITTFVSQKLHYFLAHNTEEETMDLSKDSWGCNVLNFWSGYSPFPWCWHHIKSQSWKWPLVFNFSGEVSLESPAHFELTQHDIKYSGSIWEECYWFLNQNKSG